MNYKTKIDKYFSQEHELSTDQESIIVKDFIKVNKYPSYEVVEKILTDKLKQNPTQDMFIINSEYGAIQHAYCKILYDNLCDDNIIKNVGNKLDKYGGKIHMQVCYYVLSYVINSFMSETLGYYFTYSYSNSIKYTWNHIGTWKS